VSARAVDTQLEAVYGVRARYFGTPRPVWAARRTARADRHLGYARTFAADGHLAAAAWHLVAAWRAKPWSPTVVRHTLRAVAGRGAGAGRRASLR
jgi:hypothetical protein